MPDIDFKSIGQQAVTMANEAQTEAPASTPADSGATTSTQLVSSTPVVPTPPQTGQTPVTATPVQTEVAIPVDMGNGRVENLTPTQIAQKLKDSEAGALRQADYTKKTQEVKLQREEVARQRQEAEHIYLQLQQEHQRLQQLANNPQLQQQFAQQQQQQPQLDPSQPITVGQMQQVMAAYNQQFQQLAQVQQGFLPAVDKRAAEIVEDKMQVASYAQSINSTLDGIFKENPILQAEPEFEDILRYRVASLSPQTLEETQQAFQKIGAEMASNLRKPFEVAQQQQQIRHQQVVSQGIEPPGGVPPQPTAPSFKNEKGQLDWKKLKEAAISLTGQQ